MIKCWKLRDGDVEHEKSWYLEKIYKDHLNAMNEKQEGFFITAAELEQLQREAFKAGRSMYYQKGEIGPFVQTYYQFIDDNDYLSSKSKEGK